MKKIKLEEDKIKEMNSLREEYHMLIFNLGEVTINLTDLENQKKVIISSLNSLYEKELNLLNELEKKYGKGKILTESGEFLLD